jgi:hypothetical protein
MLDVTSARRLSQLIILLQVLKVGMRQMTSNSTVLASNINTPIRYEYPGNKTGCLGKSLDYMLCSLHVESLEHEK